MSLLGVYVLWPGGAVFGQEPQPDGPVYIVQPGDSLWGIAQRFGVSIDDLTQENSITDPNQLSAGDRLILPGFRGVQGVLTTRTVPYGESLRSLSRRYGLTEQVLARLNHVTSPGELYVGYNLVIPEDTAIESSYQRVHLTPGISLLELSLLEESSPWEIAISNGLDGTAVGIPGDPLLIPGQANDGPGALPGEVDAVEITPLPLLQGKVGLVHIQGQPGMQLSGSFMGSDFEFFETDPGEYVSIRGVHAMAEPGLYSLALNRSDSQSSPPKFSFSQRIFVRAVDYPFDRPLVVNPTTIDPAVTRPEDAQWLTLATPVSPEKMWDDVFQMPSPLPVDFCLETNECWSSRFGNRRSYNGGPYTSFHTGLDIVGGSGTEIFAPAAGRVVFAGPLTVRGNATMIDHGWGVYTAYMHQSELYVQVGEKVEPGQVIGLVGGTGRVEGPHLHWEVWAGGVQVDPLDWLSQAYP